MSKQIWFNSADIALAYFTAWADAEDDDFILAAYSEPSRHARKMAEYMLSHLGHKTPVEDADIILLALGGSSLRRAVLAATALAQGRASGFSSSADA